MNNIITIVSNFSATAWLVIYLLIISIVSVILAISDKVKAIHHKWRISENTLICFGVLGGATAMLITMKLIRHKTQKKKFMIGLPIEIILHILIFVTIVCKEFV